MAVCFLPFLGGGLSGYGAETECYCAIRSCEPRDARTNSWLVWLVMSLLQACSAVSDMTCKVGQIVWLRSLV